MKKSGEYEDAVSSVIGVVLLIGLTVFMVSTIAISVLAFDAFGPPQPPPQAKIAIMKAQGGLPKHYGIGIGFDENMILIKHKGGDPLRVNDTRIMITGYGQSHRPCTIGPGCTSVPPTSPYIGETTVIYKDISTLLKDNSYKRHNPLINDGFFGPGESLLLYGDDKGSSNDDLSSVVVLVGGDGDTSNKYAFKNGTTVTVTLIDIPSKQVIASVQAPVKKAK